MIFEEIRWRNWIIELTKVTMIGERRLGRQRESKAKASKGKKKISIFEQPGNEELRS